MIDKIFEMIMKEARSRPGKDLPRKLYTVLMDIHLKILPVAEELRNQERRNEKDEE